MTETERLRHDIAHRLHNLSRAVRRSTLPLTTLRALRLSLEMLEHLLRDEAQRNTRSGESLRTAAALAVRQEQPR